MRENSKTEMYFRARMAGHSCTEVAEMFGTSRENVSFMTRKYFPKQFRGWGKSDCVYPNLRKYLNDNLLTYASLTAKLNLCTYDSPMTVVSSFLHGHTSIAKKSTIDAFLRITGMTYAELFEEDLCEKN